MEGDTSARGKMIKDAASHDPWLPTSDPIDNSDAIDGRDSADANNDTARLEKVCVFAARASHKSRQRHYLLGKAFRDWRWRKVVSLSARRVLVTCGRNRAYDRTLLIASINCWRSLTTHRQREENDQAAVRLATAIDAIMLREASVDKVVEDLVAGKLRDAERQIEAAKQSENEAKRRSALRVRAAELERDAHCEDAERERRRADAAKVEGIAAARRVAESLNAEAAATQNVLLSDAAAEREWLRRALETAWSEVINHRRRAGARNADASLHEHLVSVAGSAWADELAKALTPMGTKMLGSNVSDESPDASPKESPVKPQLRATKERTNKKGPLKVALKPKNLRGYSINTPRTVGRIVGVARRDLPKTANNKTKPPPMPHPQKAAWQNVSSADPSPLMREDTKDRDAARARARIRRNGRFGDLSHSTRAKSSPWTPKSLNVSTRAASLLGINNSGIGATKVHTLPVQFEMLSIGSGCDDGLLRLPGSENSKISVDRKTFTGPASPLKITQSKKERLADEAWETSRVRFQLSREAFQTAVEQRLAESEGDTMGQYGSNLDDSEQSTLPYVVQTPGTYNKSAKKTSSRLGLANAEGGALAIAAIAAKRFALSGNTSSDDGSDDSDDNEWLFR